MRTGQSGEGSFFVNEALLDALPLPPSGSRSRSRSVERLQSQSQSESGNESAVGLILTDEQRTVLRAVPKDEAEVEKT